MTSAGCIWLGELHLEFTRSQYLPTFVMRVHDEHVDDVSPIQTYTHTYGDFLVNTISVGLASAHPNNIMEGAAALRLTLYRLSQLASTAWLVHC